MLKRMTLIVAIVGMLAAFFAVVLNLAEGTTRLVQHTLAIESVLAGLIALACAAYCLRQGGGWRWWALSIGGPALFAMADAAMRVVLFLK